MDQGARGEASALLRATGSMPSTAAMVDITYLSPTMGAEISVLVASVDVIAVHGSTPHRCGLSSSHFARPWDSVRARVALQLEILALRHQPRVWNGHALWVYP